MVLFSCFLLKNRKITQSSDGWNNLNKWDCDLKEGGISNIDVGYD